MENNEKITELWKEYENGKKYFKQMELDTMVPLCVDFFEGRHWGKIGEKTKKLPRATFNLIEMIVNSKVSSMLSSPLKIIFNSEQYEAYADKLTKFNSSIEKEMRFDELCEELVDRGAVEGSSFVHFYWDSDAIGRRGEYKGGVKAEIIDLLNVIVHNPRETDIQKQKWIIIESRCEVDSVKKMCDNEKLAKLVKADEINDKLEQDGSELTTVLTKYYRLNGEVYFEKATKNTIICSAKPLNPNLIKVEENIKELEIDEAQSSLPDEKVSKNYSNFMARLYPIEVYQYKTRKNCIYGRGEVEPIIPNNRTINFNTAMMSKSVEDQGFGTIVQKEGALKPGDRLTNDSSKILIDRYKGGGNGFYSLDKQPFSGQAYQLNKNIMESTRMLTGATQVMTGEFVNGNQSGTSIAYLQQQAQKPLDKLNKRYKRFRARCAEILLQYYCLFYEDKEFENEKTDFNNKKIKFLDLFNGSEFLNKDFDITIEVGVGSEYSEIASINMLENLLNKDLISLKTFYQIYPSNLLPNKQLLIEEYERKEMENKKNLLHTIENLKQENVNLSKKIDSQNEIYNNLKATINQNQALMELVSDLSSKLAKGDK